MKRRPGGGRGETGLKSSPDGPNILEPSSTGSIASRPCGPATSCRSPTSSMDSKFAPSVSFSHVAPQPPARLINATLSSSCSSSMHVTGSSKDNLLTNVPKSCWPTLMHGGAKVGRVNAPPEAGVACTRFAGTSSRAGSWTQSTDPNSWTISWTWVVGVDPRAILGSPPANSSRDKITEGLRLTS